MDSAPLAQGVVEFHPLAPQGISSGALIVDGRYAIPQSKGLPPGRYKVLVSATPAPSPRAQSAESDAQPGQVGESGKELIPARYNSATQLEIEVLPASNGSFDFELVSGP